MLLLLFNQSSSSSATYTLREALTYALKNCAGVSAIVGTRVFPGLRPDDVDTNPCVVYYLQSDQPDVNLMGLAGTSKARVKVEFISPDIADCITMQTAFAATFAGYSGTINGKVIIRAKFDDEDDEADYAQTGSDNRIQTLSDIYVIRHRIPVTRF